MQKVALLAEGVDRNFGKMNPFSIVGGSPSSRRAWIEIYAEHVKLAESLGRPPRGGRG